MKRAPRRSLYLLLCLAFGVAGPVGADDYGDARSALVAAYQAQDYPAMRVAAQRALAARPDFAGALFNRALAEVLDGDHDASLATLDELLAQKVDFAVAGIAAFAPLKAHPQWDDYEAAVAVLHEPVGDARIAWRYGAGDFIPEGIAIGDDGTVYLGSIRHGDIVRLGDDATTITTARDHWSVYGMRIVDSQLWFVSSAIEQFAGDAGDDEARTGLFAIDRHSGKLQVRSLLPGAEHPQVLGDFVVANDNTFYVADQVGGMVYRYAVDTAEFTPLVERGRLVSPQGLVLDPAGGTLYVADYVGGLYRVNVDDGSVEPVPTPADTSAYGIDGLYRHANSLIAIQNGIQPHRVVQYWLSDDGGAVTASRILAMNLQAFDEPNLGQVVGDRFYFIANSHWNRFEQDGSLPAGLEGPIVLEISLAD